MWHPQCIYVHTLAEHVRFFTFYHPFLPFLDPSQPPDYYYNTNLLRFWVIISVAARRTDPELLTSLTAPLTELLWKTLAEVPQNYIVVKALCLLCTWPLPISSTSSDPTLMLAALMMQVAMQVGLHRPSHTQDFTKFKVELLDEELKDRIRTWAACNGVAQRVSTGYGQPPLTLYDWTLSPTGPVESSFRLPPEVEGRLLIERFSNNVTKALYSNHSDPVGLANENERSVLTTFLQREYEDLEQKLKTDHSSMIFPSKYFPLLPLCSHSIHLLMNDSYGVPYRSRLSLALHQANTISNLMAPHKMDKFKGYQPERNNKTYSEHP